MYWARQGGRLTPSRGDAWQPPGSLGEWSGHGNQPRCRITVISGDRRCPVLAWARLSPDVLDPLLQVRGGVPASCACGKPRLRISTGVIVSHQGTIQESRLGTPGLPAALSAKLGPHTHRTPMRLPPSSEIASMSLHLMLHACCPEGEAPLGSLGATPLPPQAK